MSDREKNNQPEDELTLYSGKDGEKRFITIHNAFGIHEAEMIRSILESAGIPVFIEKMESVYPSTMDGFAATPVVIPAEFEQEARALLETGINEEDCFTEDDGESSLNDDSNDDR